MEGGVWKAFRAFRGWFLGQREVPGPLLKVPLVLAMTGPAHLVPSGLATCAEQLWSTISDSCSKLPFWQQNTSPYGLTPREAWNKSDASPAHCLSVFFKLWETSDSVLVRNLFFSALLKTHFVVATVLNPISVSIKIRPFPREGEKNRKLSQIFHSCRRKQPKALKD